MLRSFVYSSSYIHYSDGAESKIAFLFGLFANFQQGLCELAQRGRECPGEQLGKLLAVVVVQWFALGGGQQIVAMHGKCLPRQMCRLPEFCSL